MVASFTNRQQQKEYRMNLENKHWSIKLLVYVGGLVGGLVAGVVGLGLGLVVLIGRVIVGIVFLCFLGLFFAYLGSGPGGSVRAQLTQDTQNEITTHVEAALESGPLGWSKQVSHAAAQTTARCLTDTYLATATRMDVAQDFITSADVSSDLLASDAFGVCFRRATKELGLK
jgi:hypothetical protein